MDLQHNGANGIVFGGSRGIGRSIALKRAENVAKVALCARHVETLPQIALDVATSGIKAHALPCDVRDPEALTAMLDSARRTLGSQPAGGRHGRSACR